ncbi:hypothetical protein GGR51DRAFT_558115 [Nemania sp. FL0031]|nr:hypothetical protein GGR51DRAFT_558115 [Nemania sp. FL0031]
MLDMLLEGLDSNTLFFKLLNLNYDDVQKRTKLARGLRELELLGPAPNNYCLGDESTLAMDALIVCFIALEGYNHEIAEGDLDHDIIELVRLYLQENASDPLSQLSQDADAAARVKRAIMEAFREEYHRVVRGIDCQEIINKFSNPARAWKCGINKLRGISNGYINYDIGCIIAMLCVCSAISRTLDTHYPKRSLFGFGPSYFGHFKYDLPRWGVLFKPSIPGSSIS